jgi:hypothetical protein
MDALDQQIKENLIIMKTEVPKTSPLEGWESKPTTSSWISFPGKSRATPPRSQPHTQPISSTPTPPPEEFSHYEAPAGDAIYLSRDSDEAIPSIRLDLTPDSKRPPEPDPQEIPPAPEETHEEAYELGPALPIPLPQEERIVVELGQELWLKILLGWLILIISVTAILARVQEAQKQQTQSRQPLQEELQFQETKNFTKSEAFRKTNTDWLHTQSPSNTRSQSPTTSKSKSPTRTRSQSPMASKSESPMGTSTRSPSESRTITGSKLTYIACGVRNILGNFDLECTYYLEWPIEDYSCGDVVGKCWMSGAILTWHPAIVKETCVCRSA